MTASDELKSAPSIACLMVDDIIILSADAKAGFQTDALMSACDWLIFQERRLDWKLASA